MKTASRQCCVPSCKEINDKRFSFFRFPDSEKYVRKWINAIGLAQDFKVDSNTFVCIKHFSEKEIAQEANRKTGQKARLRYGSIPRLLLDPIKVEDEENGRSQTEASVSPNIPSIVRSPLKMTIKPSENSLFVPPVWPATGNRDKLKHRCSSCSESFISTKHLFSHFREKHSRRRPQLKTSTLLSLLQPLETVYSSGSDCDYEISVSVRRIPRSDGEKEATVETSPVAAHGIQIVEQKILQDSTDDLEDELTSALILKPTNKEAENEDPGIAVIKHKKFDCGPLFKKRRLACEETNLKYDKPDEDSQREEVIIEVVADESTASVDNLDQDSDDEANDGQIRACYECKACKAMCLSSKKIRAHLAEIHNIRFNGTVDETTLYKTFPYKNIRPVNGLRAFACSVCLMMYYNIQSLKKHQIITHGALLGLGEVEVKVHSVNSNIHVCNVCHKSFLDPENLRSHLLLHAADNRNSQVSVYKCEECGLGFEYEAALNKHTSESHSHLRSHNCKYCLESFPSLNKAFYEHMKAHEEQRKGQDKVSSRMSQLCLACPENDCEETFKDSNSYYSHILIEHKKIYQDDANFVNFVAQMDVQHGKVELERLPPKIQIRENPRFSCKICDRKFTHYSFLKAHELGKSNMRYECSFPSCNVQSCSKVCLVRHFNVHHDPTCERLNFCADCPKSFPAKSDLLKHRSEHRKTAKRVYHCTLNECDKVFDDSRIYKYHLSRCHPVIGEVTMKAKLDGVLVPIPKPVPKVKTVEVPNVAEISEEPDMSDSFMPEILNEVCNEVTIYTDI